MYILKTEVYGKNSRITTEFLEFKDALYAAEHIGKMLGSIMNLTRHSSCERAINHCDYFADHYNELFISVEKKK